MGIYKRSYAKLELEHKETPSLDKMERLAAFFEIPVLSSIQNDHHSLLCHGGQLCYTR